MVETFPAQDISDAALGGPLTIQDDHFVDSHGRVIALRGLNVSPASKLPTEPNGLSHLTDGFFNHRTVTFAGRPFPLDEAPLHFRRLRAWGLPLVRLLVTWESLAHSGPDPNTDLDWEYIAYLKALVEMMPKYGIKCFVCAHQDVWSRYSGGSGAPGWTFEAAGLDIEAFTETGAAYVHGQDELRRASTIIDKREASGPFVWPSGYQKLAASTMATLFWAGDAFAPKLKCRRPPMSGQGAAETVSVQSYLQDSFIETFGRLADELGNLEACIGFENINEPHRGLINLHGFHGWNYETDLHIGHYPSLAQSLALGSGYSQNVKFYVKSWPWPTRVSHKSFVDPKGRSAWLSTDPNEPLDAQHGMGECVWRAHGVWEWDEKKKIAVVKHNDYFDVDHRPGREGAPIEWYRDFYGPFLEKFTTRVTRKSSRQMNFVEPIPNEFIPPWPETQAEKSQTERQTYAVKTAFNSKRPSNFVYAPHFYDLNVLFSKHHAFMSVNVQGLSRGMFVLNALYFGAKALRRNYKKQIGNIVRHGKTSLGKVPLVIGEVGISFDINDRLAFKTGWYDKQRELMNALIAGMEDNLVGFTLWNYNPHNRFEYGDGWNKEDFSIINGDEDTEDNPHRQDYRNKRHEGDELYRGGRVLDVVIRPYAAKIAGKPLRSTWDDKTLWYEFEWTSESGATPTASANSSSDKSCLTEFYIPNYHYENHELQVKVSDGDWSYDAAQQTLVVRHRPHAGEAHHSLVIEIRDVKKHLLQRVLARREAGAPSFPFDLVSAETEAWFDEVDLGVEVLFILLAILMALLAIGVQVFRKA
ncbi:glycoside hydrolase superfamily [Thelonectria olida]|uniref:Glycoside hydrolase superfamily n=1 Tax=Thelonectria olida TaxID=1576542 RepID=A0A9P9AR64_9HYPO|nr:glycoside hydrolase superfamily [Thelonectria olida]